MTYINLKSLLKILFYIVIFIIFSIAIGDGKIGGDEKAVYEGVRLAFDNIWKGRSALHSLEVPWLLHHFGWIVVETFFYIIVKGLVFIAHIYFSPLEFEFILSNAQTLIIFFSLVIQFKYLKSISNDGTISFVAIFVFWFASYGANFFTGGCIENTLILLVSIRLLSISFNRNSCLVKLIIYDGLIILLKFYAFPIVISSFFLLQSTQERKKYIIFMGLVLACIIGLKIHFNLFAYYEGLMFEKGLYFTVSRFVDSLISMPYGLLWGFPVIIPLIVCYYNRRSFLITVVVIMAILIQLCLYPFWHGGNGIAGNRYIFPFLLLLLPEIYTFLQDHMSKRLFLLVIIIAMLFIPTINYRHNLVVEKILAENNYKFNDASEYYKMLPSYNINYHPAVLAWKVLYLKLINAPYLRARIYGKWYEVGIEKLVPMTFLGRLNYFRHHPVPENYRNEQITSPSTIGFLLSLINGSFFLLLICLMAYFHKNIKNLIIYFNNLTW